MGKYDYLYIRPHFKITTIWLNKIVDALNELHGILSSGREDINVNKVVARIGEFSESLTLQGKTVLKDGDPIQIERYHDTALSQLISVIDSSTKIRLIEDALKDLIDKVRELRPDRSLPVKNLSNYELGAGSSVNIDLEVPGGWSIVVLTIRVEFNLNASGGVVIRWLYSQDGESYDSVEEADLRGNYYEPVFEPGSVRQVTIPILVLTPYLRILVSNIDTTYHHIVTAWTLMAR